MSGLIKLVKNLKATRKKAINILPMDIELIGMYILTLILIDWYSSQSSLEKSSFCNG